MKYGIDNLLETRDNSLMQKKWGLVTNDAARTVGGIRNRVALLESGWRLIRLFSPEHGLSAKGTDGEAQPDHIDPSTQLPVYSLYGPEFKPRLELLRDLDGLLFDLPDVGVRFYSYAGTLGYVMEACQETGKPLVILDRPNPMSGILSLAEGPMFDETIPASLIGRWSIPIRHSLTLGEQAHYWRNNRGMTQLDLSVIPSVHWERWRYMVDINSPFFPPSPAINTTETILTYPALVFLEAINISEGRGTQYPFQQFGAPWLEGKKLVQFLNGFPFSGVQFEPVDFQPTIGDYQGQVCHGAKMIVIDRSAYRPIATGIGILAKLLINYPKQVQFVSYPTQTNPAGTNHLERLLGNTEIKDRLINKPREIMDKLSDITKVTDWETKVTPYLLYQDNETKSA